MSTEVQGIQNFSKMNDKEKAYIVKLAVTLIVSIIAGFLTGSIYSESGGVAAIGFGLWFLTTVGMTWFIKIKYDLGEMTNIQIFRHGVAIGLLSYIFIWTAIFNFLI